MKHVFIAMAICAVLCANAQIPSVSFDPISVTTVAGSGLAGFADGPASIAKFGFSPGIAASNGNIFVADAGNNRIRKISTGGTVTTLAGTGVAGFLDGPATTAQFSDPHSITADNAGNLYVNDFGNSAIRKITTDGVVSTIVKAGTGAATGYAYFSICLAVDAAGNIYVSQSKDIYKITPTGVISVFASNVGDNGGGFELQGFAFDAQGNLCVRQYFARTLKISPGGVITTVATIPILSAGLTADKKGNVYVSGARGQNAGGNSIIKNSPGGVAVILAGSDNAGYKDSTGAEAQFASSTFMPLAADETGNIYVGDNSNFRIRKLSVPDLHFTTNAGLISKAAYFTISGISLTGAAVLQVPAAYELSLNEAGPYLNSLTVTPAAGEINALKVYIRLRAGLAAGAYNDFVVLSGGGASTQKMAVSGLVNPSNNQPPVSNGGADVSITLPASSITLDGSASTGNIVQYYWFQAKGPVQSVVGNNFSAVTTATGLTTPGLYTYVLQVIDNLGVHAYSQKVVTVNPAGTVTVPPCVTNLSPPNGSTIPVQTNTVLLWSGSTSATSYDVYLWTGATMPTAPTANASGLSYNTSGLTAGTTYNWYIAPRNAAGAATVCATSAKTTFTIAAAGNQPPVSNGGADVAITLPTSSVTLDGSTSYDPDGTIKEYYWFQAQGPVQSVVGNNFSAVTTATGLTTAGKYIYVLQVTDNNGVHAYSQKVVTVNPVGTVTVPACVINTSPTNGSTLPTQTTATLTWPAAPTAVFYQIYLWTGTTVPATPIVATDGLTYTATGLAAGTAYSWYVEPKNTSGGAIGCVTNTTTFTTAAFNPPTASNGGADVTITLPTSSVTLDGSASTGNIVQYYWFQAKGPIQSVVGNNFSKVTTATGLTTAGTYIYVLQVIDNLGVHAYSQKVVTVKAAGTRVMDESTQTTLATASLSKADENSSLPSVTAVISPNPVVAGQQAKLQINSNKAGAVMVNIVSSNGAVIGTKRVSLVAGINNTTVNTYGLAQGFHVFNITGSNKSINLKLLVQ